MSRKSDFTIILVTERVIVRADFAGTRLRSLLGSPLILERSIDESVPKCVGRALDSKTPPARKLLVLSTNVWNQIVSIPRLSLESVPLDQLTEVLKFEVEPLIGIDADAAVLGFGEMEGDREHRRFWTNVTLQTEWDAIGDILKTRKVRDFALAHPVVVSSSAEDSRIEFWDNSVFQTNASRGLIQVNNSPAGNTRWVNDFGFDSIESVFQTHPVLVAPEFKKEAGFGNCTRLVDLTHQESMEEWLQDAAARLDTQYDIKFPVIRQIRKPRGQAGIWLLRVATIAIVVGFCSWHLAWLNTQNAMVSVQTKQLEKPGIEKQKYDSLLGEALEKRGVAIKESAIAKSELQQVRFFFENQTDRLHLLLGKLVEFRTSELVIKQIAINEDGTVVSGVSLDSDAAPLLTNRLRDVVSSAGWKIHPASQLGLLKMTNGGPWTFSILLEDVGPPSLLREVRNNVAENGSGGSIPE